MQQMLVMGFSWVTNIQRLFASPFVGARGPRWFYLQAHLQKYRAGFMSMMLIIFIFWVNYIFGPYPIYYISIWSLIFYLCQFGPQHFSTVSI